MVEKKIEKMVPINWVIPEGTRAISVDRLLCQTLEDMVVMTLFQTEPPILLTDEAKKHLKQVNAHCISRVAVTPEKLKDFANTIFEHLRENFPDSMGGK